MIRSILIANRGEIAHRIARTARAKGIRTVGIASRQDPTALHEKACDEFIWEEQAGPTQTFLSPEVIVGAAKTASVDAIHPGYGFLSESPLLAKACKDAGIIFMGPSPEALTLFGDKSTTKELAEKLSVPVLTTTPLDMNSKEAKGTLESFVKEGEFPLLVKARAGGGGRGMRLVSNPAQLEEQAQSAAREAEKFFGDGTLLIEPYLTEIKHIEIQIAGDASGDVVHLFERECSAQRNYQKILEEAPSTSISEPLKEKLYEAAITLCKESLYQGLGTVEFLVTPDEKFYFTEVNPRLQVEHPVTEEILGIDLVDLQFHIANGQKLSDYPIPLRSLTPSGHSLQARINAESSVDYSPRTGVLKVVSYPQNQPGMRIESGVRSGSEVSPFFDSLIMKCIQSSASRSECTERLSLFLGEMNLTGVETNIPLLQKVLKSSEWLSGSYTTSLTGKLKGLTPIPEEIAEIHLLASLLFSLLPTSNEREDSWGTADSFRVAGTANRFCVGLCMGISYSLSARINANETIEVTARSEEGEKELQLSDFSMCGASVKFSLNGVPQAPLTVRATGAIPSGGEYFWSESIHAATSVELTPPALKTSGEERGELARTILSPLPGTIIKVLHTPGSIVQAGDTLFLLESMKMEHPIKSKVDGKVGTISIGEGESVSAGQELALLEE